MATIYPGGKRHMCYYYDGKNEVTCDPQLPPT